MILFNNFQRHYQNIAQEINEAVLKVLKNGWYILGSELSDFEKKFSEYNQARFTVGVASGTDAITLALKAIGIKQGDEVITTNLTAYPTITGILNSGAKPVVIDIDINTGLIDLEKIENKITNKTKAIIPVHLYGQAVNMDFLMKMKEKYSIEIIEDCAQSVGASYNGQKVGTFGICGAFSFYPTKNLGAYGDAGAIVTNDKAVYEKLLSLRNYGQAKRYYHAYEGMNSRLDEIQAAILNIKLKYIENWNNKRLKIANKYLSEIKTVVCLNQKQYGKHVYHLFVIKTKKQKEFMEFMEKNNIQTLIHYPIPIHKQQAFLFQKDEKFENTEIFSQQIVSIPIYPELNEEEINYIISKINQFDEK